MHGGHTVRRLDDERPVGRDVHGATRSACPAHLTTDRHAHGAVFVAAPLRRMVGEANEKTIDPGPGQRSCYIGTGIGVEKAGRAFRGLGPPQVDTTADHDQVPGRLAEDPADLRPLGHEVVGPAQIDGYSQAVEDRSSGREPGYEGNEGPPLLRPLRSVSERRVQRAIRLPPGPAEAPSASPLLGGDDEHGPTRLFPRNRRLVLCRLDRFPNLRHVRCSQIPTARVESRV